MGQVARGRTGFLSYGATALAAALLLVGCSSAGSSSSPSAVVSSQSTSGSPVASAPTAQTVAVGATATLPTDTITVTAFTDNILPKATKPSDPDTHWASAAVKQCATGASRQGKWEVALANGGTASEAKSFIDGEMPNALVRDEVGMLAAGDCVSGNVYFFMPDGAKATGVVLTPTVAPPRAQVTWTVS
jgi:hypothetical protein